MRVHVVRLGERQRQQLRPAGRRVLVERDQPASGAGVARHQVDDVDEVGFAEQLHRAPVGLGAEVVLAVDLAARPDDDRIPVVEPRQRDSRLRTTSMTSGSRPTATASISCSDHSKGASCSRAVIRMASSNNGRPTGDSHGPKWSQGFGLRPIVVKYSKLLGQVLARAPRKRFTDDTEAPQVAGKVRPSK